MKNKILPIAVTLVFIMIFVIFYKGLQDTNIYTPETSTNNKIPAFSAQLFYSNEIKNSSEIFNLDEFYLLNIWSSWCVPCRQEHPLLMDLAKKKNIKIFGLNYKDERSNAENFLHFFLYPYNSCQQLLIVHFFLIPLKLDVHLCKEHTKKTKYLINIIYLIEKFQLYLQSG